MNTCPNCGAQITGGKCEYCGSVFDDIPDNHEAYYQKLHLVYQLDKLDKEKKDLEFQLAYSKLLADIKHEVMECCCEQPKKRWWRR